MLPLQFVVVQTVAAHTLLVGPGRPYATPAAAIAAAAPHDTIRVAAGVYPGPLVVHRPLVLLGEAGATIDGGRTGTTLTLAADSVVVRGLTVRRSGRSLDRDDAAIKLVRCTGCRVEGVRIAEPLHGIYLLESDGAVLHGNLILGDPMLPEARRGNGIHLFHSARNRIERNTIADTRDGIYFSFAGGNQVVGNDVSRVRYGLHYMYSDDNRFAGNRFHHAAAGAALMFSKRIVVSGNTFSHNVGARAYGVLLQTVDAVLAERNRIEGNRSGLFLDGVINSTFRENAVIGNGIGIDLHESDANRFTGNVIADNRAAVRRPRGVGDDQWAVDGRGNYWDDPTVFDLDGDGVGDRPYRVGDPFATLAAHRPVLELFADTPAARALSWAEEAFPIFDISRVEDPAPLVHPPASAPFARSSAGAAAPPRRRMGYAALVLALATTAGAVGRRRARRRRREVR